MVVHALKKYFAVGFFCMLLFAIAGARGNATTPRIISLAPNLTEILYAIGAGPDVVGTSIDSDFPGAAKKISIIANAGQINLEKIIALKPTLVIGTANNAERAQLDQLQQFDIPVYIFQFKNIADIPAAMIKLGELTRHQAEANHAADIFNDTLLKLKNEPTTIHAKKIFFLLWNEPLMTIGKDTLINQAIGFCGGKNIFSDIDESAPTVNLASVLQRDPDIIIAGYTSPKWQKYWLAWNQIAAVKKHQLYNINPDYLERAGPRFVLGVQELCGIIQNGNT